MRTSRLILSFVLSLIIAGHLYGQHPSIPDYPIYKGVSAPFAGFIDGWIVVGGGCNFPDVPAAEGGKKEFYDKLHACPLIDGRDTVWSELPPLPTPLAYGAAVETDSGLICIGGQNTDWASSEVFRITRCKDDGSFQILPMPSLPVSADNCAAARLENYVYITGGNQSDGGNGLYALDYTDPHATWQKLAPYPGAQRTQPVLLATGNALYLAGGFSYDPDNNRCHLSDNILKYDIATGSWSEECTIVPEQDGGKRCLVGGSGITFDGKLILTGGVNYDIFLAAMEKRAPADYMTKPAPWYRFNDDLLVYDIGQKSWTVIPSVPGMAKAGGILLVHEGMLYMVCGETKPGIRTQEVVSWPCSSLP